MFSVLKMIIKKIHQTNYTKKLTGYKLESQQSIKKYNPGYEYFLWDDDDIYTLVKKSYPEILEVWDSLKGIQKSDLGRYAFMHAHGGYYIDTDAFVYRELSTVDDNKVNFGRSVKDFPWSNKNTATNYFFYAPKGHRILSEIISLSVRKIKRGGTVPETTGKGIVNEIITKYPNEYVLYDDNVVFNKFCPQAEIPNGIMVLHDGGTSRESSDGWNGEHINNLVKGECFMRHILNVEKRSCQFPYLTVGIFLLILTILLVIVLKKARK